MPARILAGAMCVQRFDDSLNSAIHITYRISLRSSSMPEPRDPLLKVLIHLFCYSEVTLKNTKVFFGFPPAVAWFRSRERRGGSAEATCRYRFTWVWEFCNSVMIPPLVHQRRPCYDFYFL
jgi:hypothetical protein